MKRVCTACAGAAFGLLALAVTANAAPPTVTPSPGYDARLQEQRAAPLNWDAAPALAPRVHRRRVRRTHHVSH
ncbi:hypothetical protein [Bradyrhizobium sp. dw_78]|uniref:hypothetical protein n=1 Tax=Bradyrhizobium sp. dw_78 TaxID=2719793 RepID=UPI001BD3900B|nr:hypothetical protein [Bradyrhizobium sp. dw_78]